MQGGRRPRARSTEKVRIGALARRRASSIALSTLSAFAIALSTLTLALAPVVAPVAAPEAEAFEAPTAAQLVRTSNNTWTQTLSSGVQVTYTTGTSTTITTSAAADTADAGAVRGTPTLTTNTPLATFSAAVPAVTASGCSQPNVLVGRWVCSNLATMTVTFSQPVTNPRLYIGRLGGSQNNQARVFGTDARLTASTPAGVTLTNATGATSTFESGATSFGVNVTNYTGTNGLCTDATDTAGCGSLQATGTGITSLTFALDMEIKQALLSGATGGNDEFTILATTNQQFSNGPASYNGTGGTSAPYHVQGPLQLGAAFTTAGISTTQNTTASPTAGTATGPGDAFTASSFQLRTSSAGSPVSLSVPLSGTAKSGTVCGWLDWDRSGTYETGERACASFAAGATSATLTWTMPATGTAAGPINARFRTAFGSTELAPTGGADSGEVEDHVFAIKPAISVTNSASSTAGATFTYGVTAGSATA